MAEDADKRDVKGTLPGDMPGRKRQITWTDEMLRPGLDEIRALKGLEPDVARQIQLITGDINTLYTRNYKAKNGFDRIQDAIRFATFCHEVLCQQRRQSGQPYIYHPLEVARLMALNGLDEHCIIGAVLHDVLEDCGQAMEEHFSLPGRDIIAQWFPDRILSIVESLTKIKSRFEQDTEDKRLTYEKIISHSSRDLRVLLIKVFDRLTNIRELAPLSLAKKQRVSRETLEVYVPLARWLFMNEVADELANKALEFSYAEDFKVYLQSIAVERRSNTRWLNNVRDSIVRRLKERGIEAESKVSWPKPSDFYTKDGFNPKAEFVNTITLTTEKVLDLYTSLGVIHSQYRVTPKNLSDSISDPYLAGYRALETTVIVGRHFVRFMLVTGELERENRLGILNNWKHKANNLDPYYQRLIKHLQEMVAEPDEFAMEDLTAIGKDAVLLRQEGLSVYTPNKDCFILPKGSTVIDFAYNLHRDLGDHCLGAEVNGAAREPSQALAEGDVVRIVTDEEAVPTETLINAAKTQRARHGIKRALKKVRTDRARHYGRQMVLSYLDSLGLKPQEVLSGKDFRRILSEESMGEEDFFLAVGSDQLHIGHFASKHLLDNNYSSSEHRKRRSSGVMSLIRQQLLNQKAEPKIYVSVTDPHDPFLVLGACCNPSQGEDAVGILKSDTTQMVVHRRGCAAIQNELPDKHIGIVWNIPKVLHQATIVIQTDDRVGMLADVLNVTKQEKVNIIHHAAETVGDQAFLTFVLDVQGLEGIKKVIKAFRNVPGVESVQWVKSNPYHL